MDYRYTDLPQACKCTECGFVLEHPTTHCRQIQCPQCGGTMYRVKSNPGIAVKDNPGVAAGAYTDIEAIYGPSEATEGETVDITARVKNIWRDSVHVYCVGVLDSENRFIDWLDAWIPAGERRDFSGSFVMPNHDVVVNVYTYYEALDGYIYFDDSQSASIALAVAYKGSLSRKELEYDESRGSIPVR